MAELSLGFNGNGCRCPKLLEDYVDYYSKISEAPLVYHLLSGLFVVSSLVGRKRYIVQGEQKIFGNLYILVVAPSSLYKKSALTHFGHWLAKLGLDTLTVGQVGSPEGLSKALANNHGRAVLVYPEFGTLLGKANASYMQSILELLSELYDCPQKFKKYYAQRSVEFFDTYLGVLGTSQYYSLSAFMTEAALFSGFLPRFLVCTSTDLQDHMVRRPKPDPKLGHSLHQRFAGILAATETPGEMDLTDDGWREFEKWGHVKYREGMKAHPLVQPIFGRIETHALKLCLLFGLAADPRERLIPAEVVRSAITVADNFLEMYRHLTSSLTYSDYERKLKKVGEEILTKGTLPRRELLHKTRSIPRPQLDQMLETLRQMGHIEISQGKRGGDIYKWRML
jgi:hypothetical protein